MKSGHKPPLSHWNWLKSSVLLLLGSRQTECVRNIMKDLDHYAAAIRSYLKAPLRSSEREEKLLSPTVEMIQDLRKVRVLICAWERKTERVRIQERERKSWEITLWCHLTKSSLVCTVLLPVRGRLLLTGTGFGFHSGVSSSGRGGADFKSMKQAVMLLWLLPGQRCQPVGQQLLQQQAEDVQDDEGLLHPHHHHQQSCGLHRLGRAQEVSRV